MDERAMEPIRGPGPCALTGAQRAEIGGAVGTRRTGAITAAIAPSSSRRARPGRRVAVAAALAGLAAAACRRRRRAPEALVREAIDALERAIEEGDFDALRALVSPSYVDAEGHDRGAALQTLRLARTRGRPIHLLVRESGLSVTEPGAATADLLVGMAAVPLAGPEALASAEGSVYRFSLAFAEEEPGLWRLARARWERAAPGDFF